MSLFPPPQSPPLTFRRTVWATLLLVLLFFGFYLLYRFNQIIFVSFIAIVVGTVLRPVVNWLYSHKVPRFAGAIIVYLFLLILLVGFLLLLFPLIAEESGKISTSIPAYYQSFRVWMIKNSNTILKQLSGYLPLNLSIPALTQQTGEQVLNSAEQVMRFISSGANAIFSTATVLLLAFYWTLYGPRSIQSLLMMLPKDKRESMGALIAGIESKLGFFIAGQGVLCLVVGVLAFILYTADWPAKRTGPGAHCRNHGSCSPGWTIFGCYSGRNHRFIHRAFQTDLGNRWHARYSTIGKQFSGTACHA